MPFSSLPAQLTSHGRRAFSLLEMSIVMAIIGLTIGGVLEGRAMIRNSQIQAITSDFSTFTQAVTAFNDQYQELPGDMSTAEDQWGTATTGTCPDATDSANQATCNGDGDGKIESGANENFRFWQHLVNNRLIKGSYTGVHEAGGSKHASTNNVPKSSITNVLWYADHLGTDSATSHRAGVFYGTYNNILQVGLTTAADEPNAPFISPSELWSVDQKIDDGRPGLGMIVVRTQSDAALANCTDTADPSLVTAEYDVETNSKNCAIIFRNIF